MPRWFRLIITYLEFGILLGYIFFIIAPLARIYAWFGDNERVRYRDIYAGFAASSPIIA